MRNYEKIISHGSSRIVEEMGSGIGTVADIAECCGMKIKTVENCLSWLRKTGLMKIVSKEGRANVWGASYLTVISMPFDHE